MKLRLHWTPNPPRTPFEWRPHTVAQARLALHVISELEEFMDTQPMTGKVTASWGGVEASTREGWADVEDVVPDWHDPDLGHHLEIDSDKAEEIAREVSSAYVRYLADEGIVTAGRVGLASRFVESHLRR